MIKSCLGTYIIKIDVTAYANITESGQNTHGKFVAGILTTFGDVCISCNINFNDISPQT